MLDIMAEYGVTK